MRITGYNPYSSIHSSGTPVTFNEKRDHSHSKPARSGTHSSNHTAMPAKQTPAKPVQFGGLGEALYKGAKLLGGAAYCAGEGAFWGVQALPVDIVALGGAPVATTTVAGGAFGNCMAKLLKNL